MVLGVVPQEAWASLPGESLPDVSLPVDYPDPMPRPKSAKIKLPAPTAQTAPEPTPTSTPSAPVAPSDLLPEVREEIVELRTRDSKTFRDPDGSLEALIGEYLHYQDEEGAWQDVDLNLRPDGVDWVMDRHDILIRVTPLGIRAKERASGKGIFWPTPVPAVVEGRRASFAGPLGLTWSYYTRKSGIKLVAPVPAALGERTLAFPFTLLGDAAPLTVEDGGLKSDVFSVPPPVALGADGDEYPLGEWELGPGGVATATIDDSGLPPQAFPYELDPTTTFNVAAGANDDTVRRHGTSYPPACDYSYPTSTLINVSRAFDPAYDTYDIHNAFMRWNTASIPDNATLLSATVRVRLTYVRNANNKKVTADWYVSGWPPVTCADSSATSQTSASSGMTIPGSGGDHDFVLANVTGVSKTGDTGLRFHLTGGTPTGLNRVHWASYENTSYHEPYLLVRYNRAPNAPDTLAPNGGTFNSAPQLSARFTDPDGDPGTVFFQVKNSSGVVVASGYNNAPAGSVCNGCSAKFQPSALGNGSYTWQAYGNDGTFTGPWSSTASFTIAAPLDVLKTVAPTQSVYARGQAILYTIRVTNPSAGSMTVNSVTDSVPAALALAGGVSETFTSSAPTPVTCSPSTTPSCSLSGSDFSTSSFTLAAGESRSFTIPAVVVGSDRACSTLLNTASAANGAGVTTDSVSILACDSGLGLENWWSYVSRSAGPLANASVNAANGNLVLQHTDSTPVQAHGRLAYVLRRTYNSQDVALATLPGSFGAGWTLNVTEADVASGAVSATGLHVPSLASVTQPLAVTLIDRDGTRHVFPPKGLGGATPIDVTAITSGPLLTLKPAVLPSAARICVDQTFRAPAGVHLSLWRYIRINSNTACSAASSGNPVVLGFAAMRPDRVRYEFSATGRLLSVIDPAGVELRYLYENTPAPGVDVGRLLTVYEPRSCANPATATCRAFRFSYPSSTRTEVVDPGGRTTAYVFDSSNPAHLISVENDDGTTIAYTYGSGECAGADANQLCSVTDPRGAVTRFTYEPSTLGPPRVATLTDRRGSTTTLTYYSSPDYVTADISGQRTRFQTIDAAGRVGQIDEGDTSDTYLRQALYTWDTDGATCREPDDQADNNLCRLVRDSLITATPDEDTSWIYNPEGGLLRERRNNDGGNLDTTYGYRAQYTQTGATTATFEDTVAGTGIVNSQPRTSSTALFYLLDRTQSLTPRGNQAGAGFAAYRTSYKLDNNTAVSPNVEPSSELCTNPSAPSNNTGNVCEITEPKFDATTATTTRYRYNTFGQKTLLQTPREMSYTYTYYPDSALDLSGNVSAGGWLTAVTDPAGNFVAHAYDRAGNAVRTWDRNATEGKAISQFPGSISTPPSGSYLETTYATGATAYSRPWRYARSSRDQLGNTTTLTVDGNGNVTRVRPPRGNQAGDSSFDTTQTFDDGDLLLSRLAPEETQDERATTFGYDALGNRTAVTDPNGSVSVFAFDAVNRVTGRMWTRDVWPGDGSQPSACRESTESDEPLPLGRILCQETAAYDGVDNPIGMSDGNAQTTTVIFDGVHRELSRRVPRFDGTHTTLRTDTVYDADGRITDVCPPREFTEGSGSCTRPASYSQQRNYDAMGRLASSASFRTSGGAANTTTYVHDANGNVTSVIDPNGNVTTISYDNMDRRSTLTTPRAPGEKTVTRWNYDPAGNITSVIRPSTIDVGTGAEGPLTLGSAYSAASPYLVTSAKNLTSLTLTDGAWLAVPAWSGTTGGILDLKVRGSISICSTCGITVAGRGPAGGYNSPSPGQAAPGWGSGPGSGGRFGVIKGGGGGSGGHASPGTAGEQALGGGAAGTGGIAYGATDLSDAFNGDLGMGSGGGAGGKGGNDPGGHGGHGGGLVRITAGNISVSGKISAAGEPGQESPGLLAGGGGGGGSGGTIWLTADYVYLANPGALDVSGGTGGVGGGVNHGGDGAPGRVRIDSTDTFGAGANDPAWGSSHATSVQPLMAAFSYDQAHRLLDTVHGADNQDAAQAGLVDADGGKNIRGRLAYDADGNVVAHFEPRAFAASTTTPDARYMTRADFDADGRPIASYTPRYGGGVTDLGLGSTQTTQCPTSGVAPDAIAGIPSYPAGTGVCMTRVAYDPAGNQTRVTLATATGGASSRYVDYNYTDDNLVAKMTPPSPVDGAHSAAAATSFLYDAVGREVKRSMPLGREATAEFFADGLLKKTTGMPNDAITHITTHAYDANGNSKSVTDPQGNTSTAVYYTDDQVKDLLDPLSNKTSYVYDSVGNPTQVFSPSANALEANNTAGIPITYSYTRDNLVLSSTTPVSPNGSERRRVGYVYDRAGRKTAQTTDKVNASGGILDAGGTQSFAYYPNDRLASETGRTGSAITNRYDPAGNPTTLSDPSGSTLTATYYLDGLARTVNDGSRTNHFAYDGSGAPAGRADLVNADSTKFTTLYDYNDAGLPSSMSSNIPGSSPSDYKTTSWTWDQAGRPASESAPNGVTVDWGFNPDDTLASFDVEEGTTTLASWTYLYDKNYRQTRQTLAAGQAGSGGSLVTGSFDYAYDTAGRLSSFTHGSTVKNLDWDADGNRLQYGDQIFTYNADDSIKTATDTTGANSKTFTYEPFGGLASDGCTGYTYDGFDRLTQATQQTATGCPTPQGSASYLYDALDRQRSRTQDGETTLVHHDGLSQGIATETSAGTDTFYAIGPTGTPKGLRVNNASPVIEHLAHDGHGNVTTVTTSAASVKCTLRYDPYGTPVSPQGANPCNSGSEPANSLFYRAGRRDSTTGSYQLGSRTYDPAKASFLTPDSYRNAPSAADLSVGVDPLTRNTYSYVNGDPVNLIDPSGHGIPEEDRALLQRAAYERAAQSCAYELYVSNAQASCRDSFMDAPEPGLTDAFHAVLDLAGTVPAFGEFFDLANCGWYSAEGRAGDASLSCAAAIPFFGWGATATKWGKNMLKGADAFDDAADTRRALNALDQAPPVNRSRVVPDTSRPPRSIDKAPNARRQPTHHAPQTSKAIADLPDPYAGVREASQYLRGAGVPRSVRKNILESFERGTIRVEQAGAESFGLRYFGDRSDPLGRYVFPTFPASRSSIALPPGNSMTGIAQFQIRPGATFFTGRTAPNFRYPGGGVQHFVPNLDDLMRL
jgi:RHS repeat-associated protein